MGAYTCKMPEIIVEQRLPIAEWRAALTDHAIAMTNEIYLRFNWSTPNLGLSRDAITRMFARRW
jgi:hypothetical protein